MVYYVTSRGASDSVIRDQQDYETYLGLVGEYKQRYGFKLYAYCLVPDQVHLCLEPAAGTTISAIMHDLTTRYTKYYNRRYGRSGPLFHERFKAVLVEREHSLVFVTACLHRWPSQSGMMSDFTAYPFSSYSRYMGTTAIGAIEMDDEIRGILKLMPGEHTSEAYQRYVRELSPSETERPMRQRILGSDDFIQRIKTLLAGAPKPLTGEPAGAEAESEEPADPLRRQAMLMTVGSLVAAVLGFGIIVASLYHRVGVVEQGIVVLSEENEADFVSRHGTTIQQAKAEAYQTLESAVWDIRLIPATVSPNNAMQQDELTFGPQELASKALSAEGFGTGRYVVRAQPGAVALWEAVQGNRTGEVVTWHGEWEGAVMRGTVTRESAAGTRQQLNFVGAARLPGAAGRSEI